MRLEAGKLMTEEQIAKCNGVIHTAALAAGGAGFIPIPVADAVPISAAQVAMVVGLGKIFGQAITDSAAKGLIGAAASTLVGRSLVKLIPIVGWAASAAVAAGVTEVHYSNIPTKSFFICSSISLYLEKALLPSLWPLRTPTRLGSFTCL